MTAGLPSCWGPVLPCVRHLMLSRPEQGLSLGYLNRATEVLPVFGYGIHGVPVSLRYGDWRRGLVWERRVEIRLQGDPIWKIVLEIDG